MRQSVSVNCKPCQSAHSFKVTNETRTVKELYISCKNSPTKYYVPRFSPMSLAQICSDSGVTRKFNMTWTCIHCVTFLRVFYAAIVETMPRLRLLSIISTKGSTKFGLKIQNWSAKREKPVPNKIFYVT